MTPKTLTQNLLLWGAALALAVLLSFLSGIAAHWPEGGSVDWRNVLLGVIQTILTTAPIVAAGFGLPRLGRESLSALVSEVGPSVAKATLEDEATRQMTGDPHPAVVPDLADEVVARIKAEMARDALISQPPRFLPGVERTTG